MHPARSRNRALPPTELERHGTASVAHPIPSAAYVQALQALRQVLRQSVQRASVEGASIFAMEGGRAGPHNHQPEAERMYGESQAQEGSRGIVDRWQRAIAMIYSHVEGGSPWGEPRWVGDSDSDMCSDGSLEPPQVLQSPHGRTVQQPVGDHTA
ncbi:hypothetical protein TgHK011_005773 [Trichoderma gracile]|nr:hypothetical protein TgHK011_005773 [Trichoderma gracile]